MTGPVIPASLLSAIIATVPPEDVPKLIAEWAMTLAENERRAERIKADVAARPGGYLRYPKREQR
jgi:hypothetical protein